MTTDTEVLVAGGGPTGLACAVFLARKGVPVTLVERHEGTLIHPRARTINPRTAELLRQAGIEEEVLAARTYVGEMPSVVMLRVETLAGRELRRTEQRPPDGAADGERVSPANWGMIDQDRLEILLRARAAELGADVRFGTVLTGFTQDEEGVTAVLEDRATGRATRVRARYLVGADGHHSTVRALLDVGTEGPGSISEVASMVFDADLTAPLRGRHDPERQRFIASCHFTVPAEGTVMFPHGTGGRWVFNTPYDGVPGEESCVELVRAAIGVPDLDVRLVPQLANGVKVLSYEIAARVATRFRQGRVFLAGDAAHVMPPAGAFGLGTGIQDAHNLAWKLHAVLSGRAGPGLLDTYEEERCPVAELTLGQALLLLRGRSGVEVAAPEAEPVEYDAVVFGYRYRSRVICGADPDGPPAVPPRELTGAPGTRAPHLTVRRDGRDISTLDLYGGRHVLLAGPGARAWARAAAGLDVDLVRVGGPPRGGGDAADGPGVGQTVTADPERWAAAHGVSPSGALLVRPDGFVAWRAYEDGGPDGAADRTLAAVLARTTCRTPAILNRQS
ncbi:FAD-dependent oxidoreductase [Microbispora siamensis]